MKHRQNDGFLSSKTAIVIIVVLVFAALIFILINKRQQTNETARPHAEKQDKTISPNRRIEIPASKPNEVIVTHTGFTLSYNEEHEQADWVAYKLTGSEAKSSRHERTNNFMEDPEVVTGTAEDEDYQGSGYDRGHLVPAEDMAWSAATMKESFYYSNITPQVPAFNRGVWRRLEELTRFWASYYDSIFITSGPVLTKDLPKTGKVSVPQYFYKVILEYKGDEVKAIGFILPNKASAATLKSFAVPIDSVEQLTGLDFFPGLQDEVENVIEKDAAIGDWPWTRKKRKQQ